MDSGKLRHVSNIKHERLSVSLCWGRLSPRSIELPTSESTTSSWVVRLSSHMGAEKHPTVGSSGEYWSMNESLNQHYA